MYPATSFELLLDTPELAIALVDGVLYASTVLADATDEDILIAAAEVSIIDALAGDVEPEPEPRRPLLPLDWTPPAN